MSEQEIRNKALERAMTLAQEPSAMPELPDSVYVSEVPVDAELFTAAQMRDYGLKCRRATLAEVAAQPAPAREVPPHPGDAIIAHALQSQPAPEAGKAGGQIPEGWKLVPIEPTEEMIRAGCVSQSDEKFTKYDDWRNSTSGGVSELVRKFVADDCCAMIAAAPSAPAREDVLRPLANYRVGSVAGRKLTLYYETDEQAEAAHEALCMFNPTATAPAAPSVPVQAVTDELHKLCEEMVDVYASRSTVLTVHMEEMNRLLAGSAKGEA